MSPGVNLWGQRQSLSQALERRSKWQEGARWDLQPGAVGEPWGRKSPQLRLCPPAHGRSLSFRPVIGTRCAVTLEPFPMKGGVGEFHSRGTAEGAHRLPNLGAQLLGRQGWGAPESCVAIPLRHPCCDVLG